MLQTGFIVAFAILFLPIVHEIAFDSGTFDDSADNIQSLVAQGWTWSIIFFIAGIGGNTFWFLQALQRKRREEVQF
jgi:hypothetical protein